MHAVGFFHAGEESSHGGTVSFEVGPAFRGDRMQLLPAVASADRHMAEFLEQGQRRINNAWTWTVGAADLFFDRLDDLVTMPRFLGDEMENDQAKVAMSEEAPEPGSAAVPSVSEQMVLMTMFSARKSLIVFTVGVSMVHA